MMMTRWARVLRGQIVAVVSTFAAAFSHGFADGAHPPIVAMVLALAFSSVACVLLAGVRLSRTRLAVSVAVSQLLYHGLFSLFGPAATATGTVTSGHHGTIVFTPGITEQVGFSAADQWMLIAHVAAAALTFATLVKGERALLAISALRLMVLATLAWRLPLNPVALPAGNRFPTAQRTAPLRRRLMLASLLTLRRPPRLACTGRRLGAAPSPPVSTPDAGHAPHPPRATAASANRLAVRPTPLTHFSGHPAPFEGSPCTKSPRTRRARP